MHGRPKHTLVCLIPSFLSSSSAAARYTDTFFQNNEILDSLTPRHHRPARSSVQTAPAPRRFSQPKNKTPTQLAEPQNTKKQAPSKLPLPPHLHPTFLYYTSPPPAGEKAQKTLQLSHYNCPSPTKTRRRQEAEVVGAIFRRFHQLNLTRVTIEAHHFFSEVPQLGELKTCPQKLIRRKKNCYRPDENFHGLGTQRELRKQNGLFPTILG